MLIVSNIIWCVNGLRNASIEDKLRIKCFELIESDGFELIVATYAANVLNVIKNRTETGSEFGHHTRLLFIDIGKYEQLFSSFVYAIDVKSNIWLQIVFSFIFFTVFFFFFFHYFVNFVRKLFDPIPCDIF